MQGRWVVIKQNQKKTAPLAWRGVCCAFRSGAIAPFTWPIIPLLQNSTDSMKDLRCRKLRCRKVAKGRVCFVKEQKHLGELVAHGWRD